MTIFNTKPSNFWTCVELGLAIGALPTFSMGLASLLFTKLKVSSIVEACLQNFAGGLILAAVAAELFPLVLIDVSSLDRRVGVTVGFAVGLALVFGLEEVIEFVTSSFEGGSKDEDEEGKDKDAATKAKYKNMTTHGENSSNTLTTSLIGAGAEPPSVPSPLHGSPSQVTHKHSHIKTHVDADFGEIGSEINRRKDEEEGDWDDYTVQQSATAMTLPQHRQHIVEHLQEMMTAIKDIESKCKALEDPTLRTAQLEQLSEQIDEATHSLQYKLDHTRRLLEGSESMIQGNDTPKFAMSAERIIAMKQRLNILERSVNHILGHMNDGLFDLTTIKEIHEHMEDMEGVINSFHDEIMTATNRWVRRHRTLPDPSLGDFVPMSLVIPVAMDCLVDGMLIGVCVSLNTRAGLILALANCLEMGFLGMAYAIRITRCTGSTKFVRWLTLFSPPVLMLLASGVGAAIAHVADGIEMLYVGIVGFGIVALIALVCGELLIEARENQGGEAKWYVQLCLFLGIYAVLIGA